MLNIKCICSTNGSPVNRALITLPLLTLTLLLPIGVMAAQPEDSLIFVPTAYSTQMQYIQPVMDRVYSNLMTRNSLQSLASDYSNALNGEGKISDYSARVFDIENQAGPFATELTEVLHSLGTLYTERQMYEKALESFAREEHINRVNNGLYSESLLPAVKAQIHVLNASGLKIESDEKQQYLIYLLERCYGQNDKRLLPDLINYAEWNLEQFHETIRFDFNDLAKVAFNSNVSTKQDYREQAFDSLDLAAKYYSRAVGLLIKQEQYDDPTLFHLENRLIELSFFQASRREMLIDPDDYLDKLNMREDMYGNSDYSRLTRDAFNYGLNAYKRQLLYINRDPAGSLARYIDVLLAMGDWYLLFDKPGSGYAKYREARDLMEKLEVGKSDINDVLAPEIPASLPTFTATAHSLASTEQHNTGLGAYKGYIDVSFKINRNGSPRRVEVIEVSDNTSVEIEKKLVRTLKKSRFRPRFDESDLIQDEMVALRYYYAYETGPS